MARSICPICDAEVLQAHDCADYDFTKLSIELELLDLSFDLEPYKQPTVYTGSHYAPQRSSAVGEQKRPAPLFLRM
jgi:hypothetical protein